jgi:hypothetical protein
MLIHAEISRVPNKGSFFREDMDLIEFVNSDIALQYSTFDIGRWHCPDATANQGWPSRAWRRAYQVPHFPNWAPYSQQLRVMFGARAAMVAEPIA